MCVCVSVGMCMCIHEYVLVRVCVCVFINVCVYVGCVHAYTHVYVCGFMPIPHAHTHSQVVMGMLRPGHTANVPDSTARKVWFAIHSNLGRATMLLAFVQLVVGAMVVDLITNDNTAVLAAVITFIAIYCIGFAYAVVVRMKAGRQAANGSAVVQQSPKVGVAGTAAVAVHPDADADDDDNTVKLL
jgi:hypothetical protein